MRARWDNCGVMDMENWDERWRGALASTCHQLVGKTESSVEGNVSVHRVFIN